MPRRKIWEVPALHYEEEYGIERKVTWLELFFDLMFVVMISQTSAKLTGTITADKLIEFVLIFLPIWWIWIGTTFYNERFETRGLETRLFYFLVLIPFAAMSVFSADAVTTNGALFAISYILARGIIVFAWGRAAYHVKEFRPIGKVYMLGFCTSLLLFFMSIFIPPPERFILWTMALVLETITPWFTLKNQAKLPKMSNSKRPERFGLLVIIALGEMVVNIILGIKKNGTITSWVLWTGILAISICFALWWVYFDFIARRPPRAGMLVAITWTNLHLPFVMTLIGAGAAISNVIALNVTQSANSMEFMTASISVALIFIGFIEMTLERHEFEPTHIKISPILKLGAGAIGLMLIPIVWLFHPIALMSVLLLLLFIQMAYGAYVWFTQDLSEKAEEESEELESI